MRNQLVGIILISITLLWPQSGANITRAMIGSFHFTQTAHDNWAQDGEDVRSWFLDIKGDYKREAERYIIQTTGHANYGKTRLSGGDPRKSLDELKLDLFYTRKLGWAVNPYFSAQLLTQLAAGYRYSDSGPVQVSAFLNPGYFIQTLGLGLTQEEYLAVRMGAALKETVARRFPVVVLNNPDQSEAFRAEIGVQAELDWKRQFNDQTRFTSELDLFSNLQRWNEIDVSWDNNLTTQIAKYFQTSFQYKIIYDRDISLKRQVKSVLSFGIQYTFI